MASIPADVETDAPVIEDYRNRSYSPGGRKRWCADVHSQGGRSVLTSQLADAKPNPGRQLVTLIRSRDARTELVWRIKRGRRGSLLRTKSEATGGARGCSACKADLLNRSAHLKFDAPSFACFCNRSFRYFAPPACATTLPAIIDMHRLMVRAPKLLTSSLTGGAAKSANPWKNSIYMVDLLPAARSLK